MELQEIADAKSNGKTGEANMQLQLRGINASTASKDAIALGRVAKLMTTMSPDGQRAALCWLVGYFDTGLVTTRGDDDE